MKNQALFSLKDKSKTLKCRLLQFLFCAIMVKHRNTLMFWFMTIHVIPSVLNQTT